MRPTPESFVRRVRNQLEQLSGAERQLAHFVLEFPGELASYAGNELASLAGVSPSTVSRFVRRLGYENYEAARRHVREDKGAGAPLLQSATEAARHGRPLAVHLAQSQANLAATFEGLAEDTLRALAQAVADAPQVLVFGSRSSQGFAVYLRWQLIQVVPRVTVLPGAGETLGEHLAGLGERDCVIVFGTRRQTPQMGALRAGALKAGARVAYVSDRSSPDHPGATWSLQCDCRGPGLFDNHVAVIGLCDLLATLVVEAAGAAGRPPRAAIERAHPDHDEN